MNENASRADLPIRSARSPPRKSLATLTRDSAVAPDIIVLYSPVMMHDAPRNPSMTAIDILTGSGEQNNIASGKYNLRGLQRNP